MRERTDVVDALRITQSHTESQQKKNHTHTATTIHCAHTNEHTHDSADLYALCIRGAASNINSRMHSLRSLATAAADVAGRHTDTQTPHKPSRRLCVKM